MPSNFQAIVTHRPDAVHLHAYPGLVYAPQQHGDFIAFAHNGRPVTDVLDDMEIGIDPRATADYIDRTAKALGVSFGDVCDALKYLRDQKAI